MFTPSLNRYFSMKKNCTAGNLLLTENCFLKITTMDIIDVIGDFAMIFFPPKLIDKPVDNGTDSVLPVLCSDSVPIVPL